MAEGSGVVQLMHVLVCLQKCLDEHVLGVFAVAARPEHLAVHGILMFVG